MQILSSQIGYDLNLGLLSFLRKENKQTKKVKLIKENQT